eukprot:CFRG5199T1
MPSSSLYSNVPKAEGVEARLAKARRHMGLPTNNIIYLTAIVVLTVIVVPVWAVLVLPVFIVYAVLVLIPRFVKASQQVIDVSTDKKLQYLKPIDNIPKRDDREFDVVVYGVTGHSGLLLAEYLVMKYVKKGELKIALAGRNAKKLEAARAKLAELSDRIALDLELIIADAGNDKSLEDMCVRTKVVGTTVGPFLKYGESLVRACARTGTGYCDLTGEVAFAKSMSAKYNKLALATGARIVSFTGFDSVPADIGTLAVVKKFKAKFNKAPERVDLVVTNMGGGFQGGTVDTIVNIVEHGPPAHVVGEPTPKKEKGKTNTVPPFVYYNKLAGLWTIPFFMQSINSKVVKWTNAEIGHTPKLDYNEVMVMPNFASTVAGGLLCMLGGPIFLMKTTRDLIFSMGWLPKPGQGPNRASMYNGFSDMTLYASSADGKVESLRWAMVGDPGGFQTAIYQAECAVALVKNTGGVKPAGAGLTVGIAIGEEIMVKRLRETGYLSIV